MSKPATVNESTTVYDAIVFLFLNDIGTIFVENNDILVGAVSRKDFLKINEGEKVVIYFDDIYNFPVIYSCSNK